MTRKTKLTPEVHREIIEALRQGAYEWVAAEAAGISHTTFYRWLKDERPLYRAFRDDVMRARAEARKRAEIKVYNESPFLWLRYGPGRSRRDAPGWTDSVEVTGPDGGPAEVVIKIVRDDGSGGIGEDEGGEGGEW